MKKKIFKGASTVLTDKIIAEIGRKNITFSRRIKIQKIMENIRNQDN